MRDGDGIDMAVRIVAAEKSSNPWAVRLAGITREHVEGPDLDEEAEALARALPYVVDEAGFRAVLASACAWGREELDPVCAEVRSRVPTLDLREAARKAYDALIDCRPVGPHEATIGELGLAIAGFSPTLVDPTQIGDFELRIVRRGLAVRVPGTDEDRAIRLLDRAATLAGGGYSWGSLDATDGGFVGLVQFDGNHYGKAATRRGDPRSNDELVRALGEALQKAAGELAEVEAGATDGEPA